MSAAKLQRGAQREAQRLLGAVEAFPFVAEVDRVAWLAALLTVMARPESLPAPLFVINALAPGACGSLLADALAIIATGMLVPRMRHSIGEADQRRQVIHVAQAGTPIVLLDQVILPLGSTTLDATIGALQWKARLPRQGRLATLALRAVWLASGNNVRFRDPSLAAGRTIVIELDGSLCRDTKAPLRAAWLSQSSALRASAKAILEARDAAAAARGESLAQYDQVLSCAAPSEVLEPWSALIRQTIMWLELPDPWLASVPARGEGLRTRPQRRGLEAQTVHHAD